MSDCIWIHYARPRPHWYGLEEAARRERLARWAAIAGGSAKAGGAFLGRYHVRGQHDYETMEIWRFADAEAAFKHWSELAAACYAEFNAFANSIGLSAEAAQL